MTEYKTDFIPAADEFVNEDEEYQSRFDDMPRDILLDTPTLSIEKPDGIYLRKGKLEWRTQENLSGLSNQELFDQIFDVSKEMTDDHLTRRRYHGNQRF
jgi:hypothetical protein